MPTQYSIKIAGSGSLSEIIDALEKMLISLDQQIEQSLIFEDQILLTEISPL